MLLKFNHSVFTAKNCHHTSVGSIEFSPMAGEKKTQIYRQSSVKLDSVTLPNVSFPCKIQAANFLEAETKQHET